jgi:AcrR family transcriptional regulator
MLDAKRPYRQTARAASSENLRRRIVLAFYDQLLVRWIEEITLDEVAASAGTTRQTVIRLFNSKDGVLEAVLELFHAEAAPRISSPRDISTQGSIEAVVEHYENVGDMTFRLLAQEERHPALRPQLEIGRRAHRAWVTERFRGALEGLNGRDRELQITRLVTAMDVYTWKLLRRDFGHTRKEVIALIEGMVTGITKGS